MTRLLPPAAPLSVRLLALLVALSLGQSAGAQSATVFDRGCGPVATWPRLRLTAGTPKTGSRIQITGSLLAPDRITITAIGLSNTRWGSIPLPLMIDPRPGPPCKLLVSPDVLLFAKSTSQGQLVRTFNIPKDNRLIGLKLYLQMANGDGKGNEHWTDGLALSIG